MFHLKNERFGVHKSLKEWVFFAALLVFSLILLGKFLPLYIDSRINLYIKNNPRLVLSIINGNSNKSTSDEAENTALIKKYKKEIVAGISENDSKSPQVPIVIFSDYNCVFCKSAELAIHTSLIELVGDRKIIYHELPIISQSSIDVAKLSVVASRLGVYRGFRAAMLEIAHPNEQDGFAFLEKAGFSRELVIKLRDSDAVRDYLKKDGDLAKNLKIEGTPAIIINNKIMRGWSEEAFRKMLS